MNGQRSNKSHKNGSYTRKQEPTKPNDMLTTSASHLGGFETPKTATTASRNKKTRKTGKKTRKTREQREKKRQER